MTFENSTLGGPCYI